MAGQSITLSHLAPFVDVSRKKIRAEVEAEQKEYYEITTGEELTEITPKMRDAIEKIVDERVRKEVKSGVQTIQY